MKPARQAVAVLGVVAVLMALGFALQHSPAASLVTDRGPGQRENGRVPTSPGAVPGRDLGRRAGARDNGFDLTRIDDLVQSLVILGLIIAGVVIVDRLRRRREPVLSAGRSRP